MPLLKTSAMSTSSNVSAQRTQHWFVGSATTCNNPDHPSSTTRNDLLCATGKLYSCLALIRIMPNNGNVIARGPTKCSSVTSLLFHVCHDSPFRHRSHRKDISNCQRSVLAGVDELPSVHALICDERLGFELEFVGIAEDDFRERRSSTRVVDYFFDNTSNVTMSLRVIECSEFGGGFVETGVGRWNGLLVQMNQMG